MLHHTADFLKDIGKAAKPKTYLRTTKQITIRFDERQLLSLRDLKISPIKACREFIRQLVEAHKVDLTVPHPDEVYGHEESGRIVTWREHWDTPESRDDVTGLPIYPAGSPHKEAADRAIAAERAALTAGEAAQ